MNIHNSSIIAIYFCLQYCQLYPHKWYDDVVSVCNTLKFLSVDAYKWLSSIKFLRKASLYIIMIDSSLGSQIGEVLRSKVFWSKIVMTKLIYYYNPLYEVHLDHCAWQKFTVIIFFRKCLNKKRAVQSDIIPSFLKIDFHKFICTTCVIETHNFTQTQY